MKLGLFMMPLHPPSRSPAETYSEDRDLIVLAEELGFVEAWIGEHATMGWENIPAPDQFIAWVAGQTKKIRLGTGVVLAAQHHPADIAGRIAQLDHITRGRLNFGIGVGRIVTDLELFGIDPQLPELMLFRALDILTKLWTEDPPYDMPGQFWPIRVQHPDPDLALGGPLKPFQKPYPPIALPGMGLTSRLLFAAGERGHIPMSSNLVHSRFLVANWDQVAKGAAQANRPADRSRWRICREVFVDGTSKAAREFAIKSSLGQGYTDYFNNLSGKSRQNEYWKANDEIATSDLTLEYLADNMWLVGDPDEVARQIRALYDEVGGFGTLLWVTQDWDDPVRWRNSMRLLAEEVMPRVADLT
jgi:alkanesulfonate monooxygenase SsuD/methylene tetrahydromethanopterin reductase-like flavin-dependent oxidoreductase (luciferase family)